MQSSKHINQLETFLGTQESYLQMLNTDVLSNRELLTFSALDLSTTMSQTYQISKKFCNVAFMYATLCERLHSIQKERSSYLIDIEEYSSFFFEICELFHDVKNTASVTDILCDARIPLSAEDWTESRGVWCEFETNYRAFRDLERRETTRSRDNNYSLGLETLKKMRDLFDREQKYLPNVFSHLLLVCSIIPGKVFFIWVQLRCYVMLSVFDVINFI